MISDLTIIEKLNTPATDTLPLLSRQNDKQQARKTPFPSKGTVLAGIVLGRLPGKAKTSNGHNDTSVAKARLPEYPGVVRVQ